MSEVQVKRFDEPDESISHPRLKGEVVLLGETYVGRYAHQPGWRWSTDMKPLVGTPSCQFHHQGFALSGRIQIVTDDGAGRIIGPGEVFDIPPGHDAWVLGDEPFVSVEFMGARNWGRANRAGERIMASLLFTDIVGSTSIAARMGDAAWRELLVRHYDRVRLVLDQFRGYELKTTGDGFLALFDGAARAIRCADAICEVARRDGLEVRAAVHAGEVERYPDTVQGLAVHVAARIMALAGPGEVLISDSTALLMEGSGLILADVGEHELKGLEGTRRLYRLAGV